jgi:hypothetical protein
LLPLAGQVLDDKTGLAIPAGKVTPGRIQAGATTAPPPQKNLLQQMLQPLARKSLLNGIMPYWQANSVENFANGHFALDFLPLTSQPAQRPARREGQPRVRRRPGAIGSYRSHP